MINTRLILVTGMSGAGKSTTSKGLARQVRLNGIHCRWLHEEIRNHPIRDGEFTSGSLYSELDFERNVEDMYVRWERLVKRILRSKSVYLLEGVLYDNIIRYFFVANYPPEKIVAYYERLLQIMAPLCPTVVFLYRSDVRATLEGLYPLRGEWWKNLILDPTGYRYCQARGLAGQEGAYQLWQAYQDLSAELFERVAGHKIKINTQQEAWECSLQVLTAYLGLNYQPLPEERAADLQVYCGRYAVQVGEQQHGIEIDCNEAGLYCRAFWPYMKLRSLGGRQFEFVSFPITLAFQKDGAGRVAAVTVRGEYDWEIVGHTLLRVR